MSCVQVSCKKHDTPVDGRHVPFHHFNILPTSINSTCKSTQSGSITSFCTAAVMNNCVSHRRSRQYKATLDKPTPYYYYFMLFLLFNLFLSNHHRHSFQYMVSSISGFSYTWLLFYGPQERQILAPLTFTHVCQWVFQHLLVALVKYLQCTCL